MKNFRRPLSLMLLCILVLGCLLPTAVSAASDELDAVKAVGVGYTYTTAYAPAFESLTAKDTSGNVIEIDNLIKTYPFYSD